MNDRLRYWWLPALLLLSLPAHATPCRFEPFVLSGYPTVPMPGFDGQHLRFESDAICRALPSLAPQYAQATFAHHVITPARPADVVQFRPDLRLPGTRARCSQAGEETVIDFLHGWHLTPSVEPEPVPPYAPLHMVIRAAQVRAITGIDQRCYTSYLAALESTLFAEQADPVDAFRVAIEAPSTCDERGFQAALEGTLARLRWQSPGVLRWAEWRGCVLWGWRMSEDRPVDSMNLQCVGQTDRYLYFHHANSTLAAFVGANQDPDSIDMTAVHPMPAHCPVSP